MPQERTRLFDFGIVADDDGDAGSRFLEIFPDFDTATYESPSDYIGRVWNARTDADKANRGVNGLLFEYSIAALLLREGCCEFRMGAALAFVPNILFDIVVFTKMAPVVLSLKTTLRERYKQADLEAFALKNVYRRASSHLLTMDEEAAARLAGKIANGDTLGLNSVVLAQGAEFDALIRSIVAQSVPEPAPVKVVESGRLVRQTGVRAKKT